MFRNLVILVAVTGLAGRVAAAADPTVDLSAYRPDSGITVRHEGQQLRVLWPMTRGQGLLDLDLRPGQPLIRAIGLASNAGGLEHTLIESADPVTFLLVGERQAPPGRPPGVSVFNTFFDSPATRPFQTYRSQLTLKHVRVSSVGQWVTISVGDLQIGPFAGELRLTFYSGASLVHIESNVHTQEDRRAILYDTGLVLRSPGKSQFAWVDTEGKLERLDVSADQTDRHVAVRHRSLVAETHAGSIACFPPPHQFFSPRDQTDNLQTAWFGRDHRGLESRFGFGIRQAERGRVVRSVVQCPARYRPAPWRVLSRVRR